MPAEVIDASVLAAAFFNEALSDTARAYLRGGPELLAPDLLRLEIASIAAKKVWRGEATVEVGAQAVRAIDDFVAEIRATATLAERAYLLAANHRISAYDAGYLALAESESLTLITFDDRLIARAAEARLPITVRRPAHI